MSQIKIIVVKNVSWNLRTEFLSWKTCKSFHASCVSILRKTADNYKMTNDEYKMMKSNFIVIECCKIINDYNIRYKNKILACQFSAPNKQLFSEFNSTSFNQYVSAVISFLHESELILHAGFSRDLSSRAQWNSCSRWIGTHKWKALHRGFVQKEYIQWLWTWKPAWWNQLRFFLFHTLRSFAKRRSRCNWEALFYLFWWIVNIWNWSLVAVKGNFIKTTSYFFFVFEIVPTDEKWHSLPLQQIQLYYWVTAGFHFRMVH